MRKGMGFGVATAIVVSSMAGIPGFANTPLGVSEAHADGRYGRRHHRRGDGFDLGDAIVGAVVAGGLIAVLSGASKKKKEQEDRPLDPRWEPEGDWNRDGTYGGRDSDISWQDRDWNNRTQEERAAISTCAREAEDLGSRYGREARVNDIRGLERQGGEYRVSGRVEMRGDDRDDRRDDSRRDESFSCYVRGDRITDFRFESAYAGR
ncbi:hypothetical protein [Sphingosinicella soli]|uniref:Uncharacterized protein n=1 Tax=Sphingosinicella soli TaxID=333708 RepID=A0A7W7FA11_9SPHN|nr:hypothetical protein [Sphingosinicella soli]MBB4633218.1 hypothetical protein [Sphingosinicella soli]